MRRIGCEACTVRDPARACNLPPAVLADLRGAGTALLFRPRHVIFGEGAPASALYLLCHGAVKLFHADRFGRDHILGVAAPGALLGELALDDSETMSVSAEAMTESQVLHLPRERLEGFMRRHPEAALRIVAALSRELAAARRKVHELALKGAEARLAALLLQLARAAGGLLTPGTRLQLGFGRREIAAMIGVSTETAIRLLAKLRRAGVIAVAGRSLVISDPQRLLRLAGEDEAGAAPAPHPDTDIRWAAP